MPLIKRYSNRKLYDSLTRRYVTLEEIGWMIQNGEEVSVIDHDNGLDITTLILTQVIFDQEKRLGGLLPQALFARLIKARDTGLAAARQGMESILDPSFHFEQELKRRLDILRQEDKLSEQEYHHFYDTLLDKRFRPTPTDPDENVLDEQLDLLKEQLKNLEDDFEKLKQGKTEKRD